uniref:Uncharacterized protein n=1 Tax=Arundo donax TaxID=35708 RepID=A0A0A8YUH7_ARUDO
MLAGTVATCLAYQWPSRCG